MDSDLILKDECLLRVEAVPRNDLDGSLRARLAVDAESHVGVSAAPDDLANPVDLAYVRMILDDKVVGLDEDVLDFGDQLGIIFFVSEALMYTARFLFFEGRRLSLDILANDALVVQVVEARQPVVHEV